MKQLKEKLLKEMDDLDEKLSKLTCTIKNFNHLPEISYYQQQLLIIQHNSMSSYAHALSLRIQDLENSN